MLILAVVVIAIGSVSCWLISRALDDWGNGPPLIVSPPDDGAWQANETVVAQVEATAAVIATRAAGATATSLAEARATSLAEEEIIIVDPEEYEWDLEFYDDFAATSGGWSTGEYDSERLSGSRRITEGTYIWEAEAKQGFAWWSESGTGSIADFALNVVARQQSGSSSASYGVMFRHDDEGNYYVFRIRDKGEYQVALVQDGDWIELIDWTATSLIFAGDVNFLSVGAEGSYFTFWINDDLVAEISDDTLPSGFVGLLVGLLQAGDTGRFEFDDFELYTPYSE